MHGLTFSNLLFELGIAAPEIIGIVVEPSLLGPVFSFDLTAELSTHALTVSHPRIGLKGVVANLTALGWTEGRHLELDRS